MLMYAIPSYSDYHYPSPPSTYYPLSRVGFSRAPTSRERYVRAMAEAQNARQNYLRELEEQRLLESLRQQEALRNAQLHHLEELHQAAFRPRQARNFIARRRPGRAGFLFSDGGVGPYTFAAPQRAYHNADLPEEKVEAVQDFIAALIGIDPEILKKEPQTDQNDNAVHASKRASCFHQKPDTVRKEAQAARASSDRHVRWVRAACAGHCHSESGDEAWAKYPVFGACCGHENVHGAPSHHTPLSRKPEIPRTHDRAARTIQRQWRSHSADAASRKDALNTIDTLRSRFHFLRDTFNFPEHLEFRPPQEPGQETDVDVPALSYSPLNASVHTYTNELTKLLMNADAVPSGGSRRVREARRAFVQDVEGQLGAVEARVKKVWGKRAEGTAEKKPVTTPGDVLDSVETRVVAEPVSAPEVPAMTTTTPADNIVQDVEMQVAEPALEREEIPIAVSQDAVEDVEIHVALAPASELDALDTSIVAPMDIVEGADKPTAAETVSEPETLHASDAADDSVTTLQKQTRTDQVHPHEADSGPIEEPQDVPQDSPSSEDDTSVVVTSHGVDNSVVDVLESPLPRGEDENNVPLRTGVLQVAPILSSISPPLNASEHSEQPSSVPSPAPDPSPLEPPHVDTSSSTGLNTAPTLESFDIVYPDSPYEPSDSAGDDAPAHSDHNLETADHTMDKRGHEDEGFEIL